MASQMNISTKGLEIINHRHQNEVQPFTEQLAQKIQYKDYSRRDLELLLRDRLYYSSAMLEFGKVDFVLAGNLSTMEKVAKAALQMVGVCNKFNRVSSFYLLFSKDYKTIYAFADCSININPSAVTLSEIAIKTAEKFGMITDQVPRVALLSFSTKGSAHHKNIDKINDALNLITRANSTLICDGEVQFDTAVDISVAQKKGADKRLKGKANVFIFPSLDSANIAQKIAEHIGGLISIGPMIQGLAKSVHHLPKSCTTESVINSVLLASFLRIKNN
jgi:phosphotransacetylase